MLPTGYTSFSVLLPFSSVDYLFVLVLCAQFLILFYFLSINQSANLFLYGGFNVHHKDGLTYSNETDRSGGLCCNFSVSSFSISIRL